MASLICSFNSATVVPVAAHPSRSDLGLLHFDQAYKIQREAELLVADSEYEVDSFDVLKLASESGCSAYDREFVALAVRLSTNLVTADAQLRKAFPDCTAPLVGG